LLPDREIRQGGVARGGAKGTKLENPRRPRTPPTMLCRIHTAIRADLPCWAPVIPRRALLYALTYPAGHICAPLCAHVPRCGLSVCAALPCWAHTYVRRCARMYPAVAFLYALPYPAGYIRTCAAVRACTPLWPFCMCCLTLLGTYVRAPLCAHVPRCGLSVCADLPCWAHTRRLAFLYALTYPAGRTRTCAATCPAVRANLAGTHAKI